MAVAFLWRQLLQSRCHCSFSCDMVVRCVSTSTVRARDGPPFQPTMSVLDDSNENHSWSRNAVLKKNKKK